MHTESASLSQRSTIQKFIDEKISPGVASHGGEVLVSNLENNILTLTLSGSCASCGVQAYTSESISNYILEEFPDLDDVIVAE